MEEIFKERSAYIVTQLAAMCTVRLRLEVKEQIILSKTINLSRFIKLASLDHLKESPEMENARRVLSMIAPNPNLMNSGFSVQTFSYLDRKMGLEDRKN